ncbi:hypothetical protein GGR42_002074 [Saonia flava]|uniref:3-keto-alpha-glucoside-1,2-lyase/3-keto-2-hydroxy-glucal hydratase domain-containing protein n=1 Tax=Saonia flava TaxID=523696 RepID=A0A846QY96_9FLAO|nr:hypothetical protein [Saonia flava]NJB71612.1 hypothetical protein [Saonia flava]
MRIFIVLICFSQLSFSQKIPMDATHWEHDSTTVEFVMHRGVLAAKNKPNKYYQIFLKDHIFTNGTIEFDVELIGQGFPGINFRMSEDRKNGDNFYIRSFGETTPYIRTTLQYAAIMDGMSIWDLSDEYQAGATIYKEGWNHIKLIVNGKQMKAYVNDMEKPALIVPELEGWQNSGGISLSGNVIYANLELKPNITENLSPEAGYISAHNDTRYLRNWEVTEPINFPFGKDIEFPLPSMYGKINSSNLPDSTTIWKPIKAESRAIVNLSREYGLYTEQDGRRLAWLRTSITSTSDQERTLNLGFSDEVWVFINGAILLVDKNYFGTPSQKEPKGRCTIINTSIKLPLKEGENEIMIGLANYFYGWGLIARLDKMDGITFKNEK